MNHLSRNTIASTLLLAGALAAAPADAAPGQGRTRSWFGLNVGMVSGSVDMQCAGGGDCSEGGVFPSYGLNFTVAGEMALRLRAIRAEEDTEHKPFEVAALVGPRLGRKWYALAGFGQIRNADDNYVGNSTGMAWEFVRAAPTQSGTGLEFSVHGNAFGDATFIGASIGLRFGNLR